MANVYVRSGAGGGGTGVDWANAYTTLAAAYTGSVAGDNFWVSEDHAETQASAMTIDAPGTFGTPCTTICVNHLGSVPPVSADLRTTATVSTTGANDLTINNGPSNCANWFQGITFSAGSGAVNARIRIGQSTGQYFYFKNCNFTKLGTTAVAAVHFQTNVNKYVVFDNVTITFGASGDSITPSGRFLWKNSATPVATALVPSVIINPIAGWVTLEGLDFSNAAYSGAQLLDVDANSTVPATIKNCAVNSGLVLYGTTQGQSSADALVIVSDSSGTNYRHEKYNYCGTQTIETTIVRTGGATNGTTPISWKIVTTANSKWIGPFDSIPMVIWNDTTAANVTVTVYGIWGFGSVPNNDDIWIEVSYMGASGTPISTINTTNTKADFLAANAAQTSDSSTWGGSTTAFKMAVTLSSPQPAMKGPIYVTVKAAKASATFYVDPKIVLS